MTEAEKARKLLAEMERDKQRACLAELNAILKKYGYALTTTPSHIKFVRRKPE